MANEQNLIPAKEGEPSRNPDGRPKGSRNRSTILNEILQHIKEGKDLDGTMTKRELEYWIMLKKIHNALSGKDQSINDILDWKYGKQETKQEIVISDINKHIADINAQ